MKIVEGKPTLSKKDLVRIITGELVFEDSSRIPSDAELKYTTIDGFQVFQNKYGKWIYDPIEGKTSTMRHVDLMTQ